MHRAPSTYLWIMYLLVHHITDTNRISVISNPRRHNVTATVRSICPPTRHTWCDAISPALISSMYSTDFAVHTTISNVFNYSGECYLPLTRDTIILDPYMTSVRAACRLNWIACGLPAITILAQRTERWWIPFLVVGPLAHSWYGRRGIERSVYY